MKIREEKHGTTALTLRGKARSIAFLILMVVLTLPLTAQKRVITGTITDTRGESIIGANILVKGSTTGTITDFDGKFRIEATTGEILTISYIGMLSQEIPVGSATTINVQLADDTRKLEEIVVIGYGTVKRKDVTTAITTISTDDLDQRPIISAAQALQGKAAGVSVVRPSGAPGSGLSIRVRGTTSMNSSNDPLYVVDGVTLDDISFLSANDIASMQILKDASSAAIYGSRAANGVVLITTKSGAAGKAKISMNAYTGLTSLTNQVEVLNAAQYRELLSDMGSTTALPDNLTDQTDWYKETFKNATTRNYQLSVSNATDKLNYYVSAGYTGEEGIIKVAFFERFNFRSNIENQIRPWLKIGANISYSDYTSNGIISGQGANRAGVVLSVLNTPTYAPVMNPNNPEQFNTNFYGVNITSPVENMARSEDNKSRNNRLISTGSAEITFLPSLKLRSTVTLDRYYNHSTSFLDPQKTSYGRSQRGVASDNRSLTSVMIYDNILTYNKNFGDHSIDAMGGTSGTTSYYTTSYQTVTNYADGSIKTLNAGNRVSQGNGTFDATNSMMSYIGRVAYNYMSKYLVTANMRIDGSSKLHPDHRWGYFPSFSGAWRMSSEEFMSDLDWIDDLKVRGGWGQTGNLAGLGDHDYLERYGITRVNWWEVGKANAVPIITQTSLRNTDLTWETTTQSNIGIDFTLLKNRLNLTVDYYFKRTTDMLMNVSLPTGSAAASSIKRNEGEMTNRGFEFSVNSRNMQGAFSWNTDFNISFNKNRLESLALTQIYYDARTSDVITEYIVRNEPGRPLGGFYGYFTDGVDPETGEFIYRDLNKDGQLTSSDRDYIGDPNPDFVYGMTNTFSYKGFNLSIFLQGSQGNDIFNASRIETEGMYDGKNQSIRVVDRWRRPGMETTIPKAGYDLRISDFFVEDGSYMRLKDLTLSYDFGKTLLKKSGISRLQPYFTASNLLTITRYLGFDPEVNQWGNSGTVQGIDWGTYPQTRSFIVGLNIEF